MHLYLVMNFTHIGLNVESTDRDPPSPPTFFPEGKYDCYCAGFHESCNRSVIFLDIFFTGFYLNQKKCEERKSKNLCSYAEYGLHCPGFRQTKICPAMLQDMEIFCTEIYPNLPKRHENC